MSEITQENAPSHIQKLYHYVGVLARNHNKIVDHLTDIHKNVKSLHENLKSLRGTLTSENKSPTVSRSVPSTASPTGSPRTVRK